MCIERDNLLYYTLKTKCAIFDDLVCVYVYKYVCMRTRIKLPNECCSNMILEQGWRRKRLYVYMYVCIYVCRVAVCYAGRGVALKVSACMHIRVCLQKP